MIYAYFGKCELKYFGLFVADNDSSAIRMVEEEIQRNKKLADYCSEYSLYAICDFNEDSGLLSNQNLRFVSEVFDIFTNFIVKQRKQKELLSKVSGISLEDESTPSDVEDSQEDSSLS